MRMGKLAIEKHFDWKINVNILKFYSFCVEKLSTFVHTWKLSLEVTEVFVNYLLRIFPLGLESPQDRWVLLEHISNRSRRHIWCFSDKNQFYRLVVALWGCESWEVSDVWCGTPGPRVTLCHQGLVRLRCLRLRCTHWLRARWLPRLRDTDLCLRGWPHSGHHHTHHLQSSNSSQSLFSSHSSSITLITLITLIRFIKLITLITLLFKLDLRSTMCHAQGWHGLIHLDFIRPDLSG